MEEAKETKEIGTEWKIPQCCRELWDSCTHVVKPTKKKKVNVGL